MTGPLLRGSGVAYDVRKTQPYSGYEQYDWTYLPLLSARGYDVCTVTYPDRGLGDMQVSAEYVVHALRRMHEATGRKVAVVGFSYRGSGTEIGLFRVEPDGRLTHRSTHHLRSGDYYSSRNYASRLIGDKLVFYTPTYLALSGDDPFAEFPAVRRWHRGAQTKEFRRILPATRVYRPGRPLTEDDELALHTVTVCDLGSEAMGCEGTAVLGSPGRVFYVSPEAVYVWTSQWRRPEDTARAPSMLYRIPLNGGGPSALRVHGSPIDQFSFLESRDRHLNVLVRSDADGDGMWHAEATGGDAALLRVSLDDFGDGGAAASEESYRPLPAPRGHTFQNRFVGDYLLYGTGSGWGYAQHGGATLYAVPWVEGSVTELPLPHGVDRIEAMGSGAVIIGSDGRDLHFSGVRLGPTARLANRYTRAGASQGETRSHGFFYRALGDEEGLVGLPVIGGRQAAFYREPQPQPGTLASCGEMCRAEGDGLCDTPFDPGPALGWAGCRSRADRGHRRARDARLRLLVGEGAGVAGGELCGVAVLSIR